MPGLGDLPLEVLLLILGFAPDLVSLHEFIRTSSWISEAFDFDPVRIVEKVIQRQLPQLQKLQGIPVPSEYERWLQELQGIIVDSSEIPSLWYPSSSKGEGLPIPSSRGPRFLCLTAYRIQQLEHICLATLLDNMHQRTLTKPEDPNFMFRAVCGAETLNAFITDTLLTPATSFRLMAWWAPSPEERFRVRRALWKLMVYWNLRAIDDDILTPSHLASVKAGLLHFLRDHRFLAQKWEVLNPIVGPSKPSEPRIPSGEPEELWCVAAAVQGFLNRHCRP
ncbi:hypothetical protein QBC46DRAFT_424650 [Diplogelasinospora grovesii]|uniref:F-box domain-containing protein n=1 Tax=Diplogelasinospora grovesii TaxID=303347 RepID=A0AAN6NHD4_9PEZI|nr:hypothetical protein QBC46DRAFT_424650 [Diplogelasinospora grovesii]